MNHPCLPYLDAKSRRVTRAIHTWFPGGPPPYYRIEDKTVVFYQEDQETYEVTEYRVMEGRMVAKKLPNDVSTLKVNPVPRIHEGLYLTRLFPTGRKELLDFLAHVDVDIFTLYWDKLPSYNYPIEQNVKLGLLQQQRYDILSELRETNGRFYRQDISHILFDFPVRKWVRERYTEIYDYFYDRYYVEILQELHRPTVRKRLCLGFLGGWWQADLGYLPVFIRTPEHVRTFYRIEDRTSLAKEPREVLVEIFPRPVKSGTVTKAARSCLE